MEARDEEVASSALPHTRPLRYTIVADACQPSDSSFQHARILPALPLPSCSSTPHTFTFWSLSVACVLRCSTLILPVDPIRYALACTLTHLFALASLSLRVIGYREPRRGWHSPSHVHVCACVHSAARVCLEEGKWVPAGRPLALRPPLSHPSFPFPLPQPVCGPLWVPKRCFSFRFLQRVCLLSSVGLCVRGILQTTRTNEQHRCTRCKREG